MWVVEILSAGTYLLLWHLFVLVEIQGCKKVCRAILQPHKQVTRRHSLLKAHQFNVKDQHSTAWHTSSCRIESKKTLLTGLPLSILVNLNFKAKDLKTPSRAFENKILIKKPQY